MPLKPKQAIPFTQKDKEWKERNVDYYREMCTGQSLDKAKYQLLYKLANGELDETEYTYVTNPLSTNREELKGYPARIRNVDIISGEVLSMMGEKADRPLTYNVLVRNGDFATIKKEKEKKILLENLQRTFLAEFKKANPEVDLEAQPIESPEVVKRKLRDINDDRAIRGQHSLNYIMDNCEIPRKLREAFYHWLVTARVFSYKGVEYDDVVYDPINVLELDYLASANTTFIEDGEAAKRTVFLGANDIIDRFRDVEGWNDDILKDLEGRSEYADNSRNLQITQSEVFYQSMFGNSHTKSQGIEVTHVVWKSMYKIGKRSTTDIFGNEINDEVDESYVALDNEKVEWEWRTQVWEGYKIDDKHYLGVKPLDIQRRSESNPSVCKLPYNGRLFCTPNTDPKSLVEKGHPYQIKFNIIHYFLEKLIAKNKDKVVLMPMDLIPNKEGWDEFTTMYYMDAAGVLWTDLSNRNAMAALQHIKVLDMSLSNLMSQLYDILRYIQEDWRDLIGMTRQRKGNMTSSDGKAVTEQAIYRGSLASEELFMEFEEFERRELQGFLDLSRYAWRNGKKLTYINTDGQIQDILIDGEEHNACDYGLFVFNSRKEQEKANAMKGIAQAFAQNQGRGSAVLKLIQMDNPLEMIAKLEEMEYEMEQMSKQKEQADREVQIQISNTNKAVEDAKTALDYYDIDSRDDTKIQVALIQAQNDLLTLDTQIAGTTDSSKGEELNIARQKVAAEINNMQKSLEEKAKARESKERTDRYKVDKMVEVAKTNKNKYDK